MKQLIIYDLDGTLVDTLADLAQAVNDTLRVLQAPALPSQEVRRHVGRGVHELMKACLKVDDAGRLAEAEQMFRAFYARHLVARSRLYPGAQAALEHFRWRSQAVVTNKPNPFAQDLLAALGVAGYFCAIVAGDSAYPRKPDPSSVQALMRQRGVAAAQTILVGDSPIDIETGRRAGVLTAVVTHGFCDEAELASAAPDLLVKDFDELLACARTQGW